MTTDLNDPAGHADPDGEAPWAMQLVIRIDKAAPPTRTAVCEAAATAVVRLLTDPEAAHEWAPAIERWTDGRIRKHARRASRPAAWAKVADLPGVTVEHDGAQVRAFVPSATDAIPADIAKLQLSGTEPDGPGPSHPAVDPVPAGVVVVTLNPIAEMPLGKAAAAAGHAAQLAFSEMPADRPGRLGGERLPGGRRAAEQRRLGRVRGRLLRCGSSTPD